MYRNSEKWFFERSKEVVMVLALPIVYINLSLHIFVIAFRRRNRGSVKNATLLSFLICRGEPQISSLSLSSERTFVPVYTMLRTNPSFLSFIETLKSGGNSGIALKAYPENCPLLQQGAKRWKQNWE
jgi:hypothetical protein